MRHNPFRFRVCIAVLAVIASATAFAGARIEYNEVFNGPPYYATPLYVEGEPVTPVIFYRNPDDIPDDANLLAVDFNAQSIPFLMDGFIVFGDNNFVAPTHQEVHGEFTPVWFVDTAAYEAIAADGDVTMPELEGLAPVLGLTEQYYETVHFGPGEAVPFAEVQANGILEGGHTWTLHLTEAWLPPSYEHVIIHYEFEIE